jgi:hypothetical protein
MVDEAGFLDQMDYIISYHGWLYSDGAVRQERQRAIVIEDQSRHASKSYGKSSPSSLFQKI